MESGLVYNPTMRSMNFFKNMGLREWVIQDTSKPTIVAMIWLRVEVNTTRLWAPGCARQPTSQEMIEILKISEESRKRTFLVQPLCMYGLSFIPLYKQKFYKCYSLSPS